MKNQKNDHFAFTLLKGLIVGLVATQALDLVGSLIYENEDDQTREDENATRNGRQAYEVGVAKIAKSFGRTLTSEEEKVWGWRFHKSFGILGGLQYVALRKKYPKVAAGWGLAYGASFFLIADELLIYLGKMTPGPFQYSWKVHGRGALAHTAYGVAAETAMRAIEALPNLLIPEDRAYLVPKKRAKPIEHKFNQKPSRTLGSPIIADFSL
jgi:uncharacterized membrane protein YagU involved in acid resistance